MNDRLANKLINIAKYGLVILALTLTIYVIFHHKSGIAFGVETTGTEFGISLFPDNNLFQVNNMAPGDVKSADLMVSNKGKHDFTYSISAKKDNGSDLLYNEFNLIITDKNGNERYSGKLKDLANYYLGVMTVGGSEEYNFKITFPKAAGNEYQGLTTSATFTFNATEYFSSNSD